MSKKRRYIGNSEVRKLGSLKDKEDERDYLITARLDDVAELPKKYDLLKYASKVKNQGSLGSCVGHGLVLMAEMERKIQGKKWNLEGSELFNYILAQKIGGLYPNDVGSYPRDGCKVLKKYGDAPEKLCPYDVRNYKKPIGVFAYAFAKFFKIQSYWRVKSIEAIKMNIANKHPVGISIPIYQSFYNVKLEIPLPKQNERKRGYHFITIIGYDDDKEAFLIQNSWGRRWGRGGRAWLLYEYVRKHANKFDAWTIRLK